MKTALITGVTGQDGSYLSEFLLEKGADVTATNNSGKSPIDLAYAVDIKNALQSKKKSQSPKKQVKVSFY